MREFISFEGRGGTAECLLVGAAAIVVGFGAVMFGIASGVSKDEGWERLSAANLLVLAPSCGWAYASALIRRLRDAGHSPYWAIPCFAPFIGVIPWLIVALLPSREDV